MANPAIHSVESTHRLRVFLNYASEDKSKVKRLCRRLQACGFDPWFDKEHLMGGQYWRREIKKEIQDSDVFIACLSSTSVNKKGYVQEEIESALEIQRLYHPDVVFIIPLRLDKCEDKRLEHLEWINYFEKDGFKRLVSALKSKSEERHQVLDSPVSRSQTSVAIPKGTSPQLSPLIASALSALSENLGVGRAPLKSWLRFAITIVIVAIAIVSTNGPKPNWPIFAISESGQWMLMGGNNGTELRIIDVASHSVAGRLALPFGSSVNAIKVRGNLAYIAGGVGGLFIADLGINGRAPGIIGMIATHGVAVGLDIAGHYAYVADNSTRMEIVNISNPQAPFLTRLN